MDFNLLFLFFSIILVICATMVVISNHQVFSLLFLVSSFITASILLFCLECEFIALLFIVIYVGAIAVLFLFAVMMLESKLQDLSKNLIKYLPIGIAFGIFFILPFINEITNQFRSGDTSKSFFVNSHRNWYEFIDSTHDIEVYGQVLYSYFVLQFLISGLILLVVLVGVVYLTNSFSPKYSRHQSTFKQLSRSSQFFFR